MPREFRFYGKKRGQRRTGSNKLGRRALGLFFAVFLLVGFASLSIILSQLTVPEWRVNHEYREASCRLLAKQAQASPADASRSRPGFQIQYEVGKQSYSRWAPYEVTGAYSSDRKQVEDVLRQFHIGQSYPCWYDPRDPETVVLSRGYTWFAWLMLLLPGAFITIGGGGLAITLLRWDKSTERLAAMTHNVPAREIFEPMLEPRARFPGAPDDADLVNSPGVVLRYRLPTTSASWTLLATLAFCVFWNGIVAIFLVIAMRGFQDGKPEWFLTLFLIPFVAVGIGAICVLARQLLVATGVGPTTVEIAEHPLAPGQATEVYLSQTGRLTVNRLRVLFVCEESAIFRQGTNTRTAVRRVHEQEVYRREGFEIHQGMPFEARFTIETPQLAMHSFVAPHNRIDWKLIVCGDVRRWPDFERAYPIVVYPQAAVEAIG